MYLAPDFVAFAIPTMPASRGPVVQASMVKHASQPERVQKVAKLGKLCLEALSWDRLAWASLTQHVLPTLNLHPTQLTLQWEFQISQLGIQEWLVRRG